MLNRMDIVLHTKKRLFRNQLNLNKKSEDYIINVKENNGSSLAVHIFLTI